MTDFFGPRRRIRRKKHSFSGVTTYRNNGEILSSYPASLQMYGCQITDDEVKPPSAWFSDIHRTNFDVGGPFHSLRCEYDFPIYATTVSSNPVFGGLEWRYEGPVIANPMVYWGSDLSDSGWRNELESILDPLDIRIAAGATAISRCKPASPEAGLGMALIELKREGVPSLLSNVRNLQDEILFFKSLGSNYLNVEFGWKPIIAEIRATAKAITNHDSIVTKLRSQSDERIRRQYRFPDVVTESVYHRDNQPPWPNLNAYQVTAQAERRILQKKTKRTWFSGEFIYHYPAVGESTPSEILAWCRHVLGVDMTPETLWNVTPWTWLSDWLANIGDVMANISAISDDGLVMRYGYLMQEVELEYKHEHIGVVTADNSLPDLMHGTFRYTAKSRIKASPYGFGFNWDGFSARQIAILAALGITRGRLPSQG